MSEEEIEATDASAELAEEHNVNLAEVEGSGIGGRIVKSDVEAFIEGRDGPVEEKETSEVSSAEPEEAPEEESNENHPKHGEQRRVPQDRMDKRSAYSIKENIIKP